MAIVGSIAGSVASAIVGANTDPKPPFSAGGAGGPSYDTPLVNLVYDSEQINLGMAANQAFGVIGNPAGDKLYVHDIGTEIQEWSFTPGTLSGATETATVVAAGTNIGFGWNDDGTKLFVSENVGDDIWTHVLSTPYDLSTAATRTDETYYRTRMSAGTSVLQGVEWNDDGTKIYVSASNHNLYEFDCSVAYDPDTASASPDNTYATGQTGVQRDFSFTPDGLYLVTSSNDETVRVHELSTAWDISTASFLASYNLGTLSGGALANLSGVYIDTVNQLLYGVDRTVGELHQFSWAA